MRIFHRSIDQDKIVHVERKGAFVEICLSFTLLTCMIPVSIVLAVASNVLFYILQILLAVINL